MAVRCMLDDGGLVTALDKVAAPVASDWFAPEGRLIERGQAALFYEMIVALNGGALTSYTVDLEGSDDGGVTVFQIDTSTAAVSARLPVAGQGLPKLVRANLKDFTIGAGAPTVTVLLGAQ